MRTCHSLAIILLALLSRVSAEGPKLRPVRVIATIPSDILKPNQDRSANEARPTKNVEVTGFITKDGDIFELSESGGLGSIESREEPELEPGMTMCRYGTIVVYSDADCNTFFQPSANLGLPLKTINKDDQSVDDEETEQKPLKKNKKRTKGNRRKPTRNKVRKQKKNKKNTKRRGNKNRKRNQSKPKRRKNLKQRNQRRGNKKNVKRKRINNRDAETRSNSEPITFRTNTRAGTYILGNGNGKYANFYKL